MAITAAVFSCSWRLIVRQGCFHINKRYYQVNKVVKMPSEKPPKVVVANCEKAVQLLKYLSNEINMLEKDLESKTLQQEQEKLLTENAKLEQELNMWKAEVTRLEVQLGIRQVPLPSATGSVGDIVIEPDVHQPSSKATESSKSMEMASGGDQQKESKEKKKSAPKPAKAQDAKDGENADDVHIGRFDLRIGRIITAQKHPEADSLYLEQIDLGEEKPRTVVSGLVKFIPLEEMQNRLVMVLCNLKPVKMRGITSEAMVMCASTPEKVEILIPPGDAVPGEQVTCDEFLSKPDPVLNPKKKVLEQVLANLKTNSDCVAVYKSCALKVGSKGVIKSTSLADVQIK